MISVLLGFLFKIVYNTITFKEADLTEIKICKESCRDVLEYYDDHGKCYHSRVSMRRSTRLEVTSCSQILRTTLQD